MSRDAATQGSPAPLPSVTRLERSVTRRAGLYRAGLYYGWIMVPVAAAAMVATFPGRTFGLGIITERLINDPTLQLSRTAFGQINLWATLIGALFCLGVGRLIDRYGVRLLLPVVLAALGLSVFAMNKSGGLLLLFCAVTLTRGFGQSALSVVSLSIVGKWFQRRLKWAMGLYALLLSVGFVVAFVVAERYAKSDWRTVWGGIAWILLVAAPLAWLITRDSPEACGFVVDGQAPDSHADEAETAELEMTVSQALATPAFWIFAIGTSLFNLISSGVLLFNESILVERGFPSETYYVAMAIGTLTGLLGNVGAGWLISRRRIAKVTAAALVVLAGSLIALGALREYWQVMCWTAVNGAVGGVITVVFFAVWSSLYGRQHLGKIQGAAQMLTVFASATGPLLFAEVKERTGSYLAILTALAIAAAVAGVVTWFAPLPRQRGILAGAAPGRE
jgi:MFS family permease